MTKRRGLLFIEHEANLSKEAQALIKQTIWKREGVAASESQTGINGASENTWGLRHWVANMAVLKGVI